MAINFVGSQYDERVYYDLNGSSSNPYFAFGRNVTIYGVAGNGDPDPYYNANYLWQDSAAFDISTNVGSSDPRHPDALVVGKTYDIKVVVYDFARVDVKIEDNTTVLASNWATNYGEYTFNYSYTPTNASQFFNVALKITGSTSNYKITLTERASSPNPPAPPTPPAEQLPDLTGQLLSLKADSVESGGTITVRYDLLNQGTLATSSATFDVYLSKDPTITNGDIYLGTIGGLSISAGETRAFETTTLSLPADLVGGQYFVGVITDSANLIKESNEQNNTSTAALPVLVRPNLDEAVREAYRKMYAADVKGQDAEILQSFADAQYEYGRKMGVYSPFIYANEAMGLTLAERARDGSTAFSQNYGPATLTSMELFTREAYHDIFGRDPTSEASQHFLKQLEYFENLYKKSGAYGSDQARLELLARGAVFGQMVGIQGESAGSHASQLLAGDYDFI